MGVDIKTPVLKIEFIIQNNDTKNNFYKKLNRVIYAKWSRISNFECEL